MEQLWPAIMIHYQVTMLMNSPSPQGSCGPRRGCPGRQPPGPGHSGRAGERESLELGARSRLGFWAET